MTMVYRDHGIILPGTGIPECVVFYIAFRWKDNDHVLV